MFNSANSLHRANVDARSNFFGSSMLPTNLSAASFELLSKNNVSSVSGSTTSSAQRALQQYHQSPFAIQQLLGLTTSNNRASPSPQKVSHDNKLASPAHSTHSSGSNTETSSNHSSSSRDDAQTETNKNMHQPPSPSAVAGGDHSRASSSISVGSHGTLSPIASPKLPTSSTSTAPGGSSSLSVSNLVNNHNNHPNFSSAVAAAYFPSSNSPLSQSLSAHLHHHHQQQHQHHHHHHSALAGSPNSGNCFGSNNSTASPGSAGNNDGHSPPISTPRSIPSHYFNSPAAAAFMSAASMHVGLQQVNSISKSHHHAFSGSSVNNAISSMFHPFASDVAKSFSEKTANSGKWQLIDSFI